MRNGTSMLNTRREAIRIAVIADCDYQETPLGGVVSLLRNMLVVDGCGLVEFNLIGISFDPSEREGEWQQKSIQEKKYPWFPAFLCPKEKDDTRIPLRFRLVAGIRKYRSLINLDRFDAIYIHSAETILALGSIRVPIVVHVHGDPLITITRSRFRLLHWNVFVRVYGKIIKKAFDRASGIIWAANSCRRDYYRRIGVSDNPGWDNKSAVIHSSVDPLMLESSEEYSLPLNTSSKKIITVGRLSEVKHIDFLIEVFSEMSKARDSVFYIAGAGECESSLRNVAQRLGCSEKVCFLGNVNKLQLASLLSQMDVFVFASESEAMSLVVLESMAAGVPVVSTKVGDLDEVVNESTGALIEGRDLPVFVNAVGHCLDKGKEHYSKECRRVARGYTASAMRGNIERFIESCIR